MGNANAGWPGQADFVVEGVYGLPPGSAGEGQAIQDIRRAWKEKGAAAALARVAVGHADACLKQAAKCAPAEAAQLEKVREALAKELAEKKVAPLRVP